MIIFLCVGLSGSGEVVTNGEGDLDDPTFHLNFIRTVTDYWDDERQIYVDVILEEDETEFIYHPEMKAYELHGYVNNTAGRYVTQITLGLKFYDEMNRLLVREEEYFNFLEDGEKSDFIMLFYFNEFFETVDHFNYYFDVLE
jgi:hypothetical protein